MNDDQVHELLLESKFILKKTNLMKNLFERFNLLLHQKNFLIF
jgi:hypothetical protein